MEGEKQIKTQLEIAKEDIEDLEVYIEELHDFLPLALLNVNPLGIIIEANKAFKEMTGLQSFEIIGREVSALFKEKEKIENILKKAQQERKTKEELTLISKNEGEISVSVSIGKREDENGNFIGYFIGLINITELKELQKNLEKKVEERTKELRKRVEELEELHRITVGRELKMLELKNKIQQLEKELEKYKKNARITRS